MISFTESIRLLADTAKPLGAEDALLDECDGHVLATPVVAHRDSPAFSVSAMDGYAVRSQDLAALPTALPIIGKSFAGGGVPAPLPPGVCMRVFTGAPVPDGADYVIVQEDVTAEGERAHFRVSLGKSRHIRAVGSDFSAGNVLVPAGVPLNPQRLVAVAAADMPRVRVIRRPRVSVIACGDELTAAGSSPSANRIPDSISIAVAALAQRWNGVCVGRRLCPDDLDPLTRAAEEEIESADVIVVTGGASVGERDYAIAMFSAHGLELIFNKVAIRPGKPVWLGRAGKAIVLGLPGNPTSALVTGRLYLAPLLFGMSGHAPQAAWDWHTETLAEAIPGISERDGFLRAMLRDDGIVALTNQDSAAQKMLAEASFLIHQEPNSRPLERGEPVSVLPF